ncbi:mRNA turnover and ribosome assembly protein [Orbilia oligospora]|uniref:Ribosome assembly factor mrt4 n=1 Tax=Orbilia oligospora TaxID=2813651 RepID=A0A7C8N9H0_ORBOL|nr:mRNA turnover and ribosome assembly protein [Orbilia oligospora]KAF3092397.1 mRNA turnover and ribosome assembly protein [Orbilia oligospora]KAF3109518.1 mRNA turnover and ribosome assembly protein [Orbilia oligospora]KAF3134188.1 mRNA turnover and ribosome assembly protein [Orbilia oligospora]KAF3142283.1 mRNA turnover and ribosome assembly protein [Orbilia oligospora]
MPKSKRNKLISLTKTQKKGRENNVRIFDAIRAALDEHSFVWVFSVASMRNAQLKEVRAEFQDSRIFFGKTKVMTKALGTTREDEYRDNLSKLSKYMNGEVGLLLTNRTPEAVTEFFDNFSAMDFARAGAVSPLTFTVPAGTVYSRGGEIAEEDDVPLAHSLETTVRGLGMPTRLVNGKVTLNEEYTVCEEGDVLNSQQTRLLKLFGVVTSEFKVKLSAYWSSADSEVKEIDVMEEEED